MFLGYAKAAIAFLEATGLLTKILFGLGVLAALGTAYTVWHHEVYERGVSDAIAGIARADAGLVDRARKGRVKLKECESLNKSWDQSTGQCR